MSSSCCWKKRSTGPSKAEGIQRAGDRDSERWKRTESQREGNRDPMWGHRDPEGGGQRHRGWWTEAQREWGTETQKEEGQRFRAETQMETRTDPQNHRLGGRGGQGLPAIRRARTKGPGIPSPSFPQPPSGEGLAGEDTSPQAPGPAPPLPAPALWARIQLY